MMKRCAEKMNAAIAIAETLAAPAANIESRTPGVQINESTSTRNTDIEGLESLEVKLAHANQRASPNHSTERNRVTV
jgi:hypothetical protein